MNCSQCKTATPSNRLKIVRTMLNLDQKYLLTYLGVGISTYSKWENGKIEFREKHKLKLSTAGISWIYIETGLEVPFVRDVVKIRKYIVAHFENKYQNG